MKKNYTTPSVKVREIKANTILVGSLNNTPGSGNQLSKDGDFFTIFDSNEDLTDALNNLNDLLLNN